MVVHCEFDRRSHLARVVVGLCRQRVVDSRPTARDRDCDRVCVPHSDQLVQSRQFFPSLYLSLVSRLY